MKRIVPIKIIPIHELKRGDLISFYLKWNLSEKESFESAKNSSVLEFIEFGKIEGREFIKSKLIINLNDLHCDGTWQTWSDIYRNECIIVKIEDDGASIESSNRAENENDEPRSVIGIEKINQTI